VLICSIEERMSSDLNGQTINRRIPRLRRKDTLVYRMWYNGFVADVRKQYQGEERPEADRQGKRVRAVFYRTEAGGELVREWLKSLPSREDRKRIGETSRPSSLAGRWVCRYAAP
jgi:hypothetical protein